MFWLGRVVHLFCASCNISFVIKKLVFFSEQFLNEIAYDGT